MSDETFSKCLSCQAENPVSAACCSNCGIHFETTDGQTELSVATGLCPKCEVPVTPADMFCGQCGLSLVKGQAQTKVYKQEEEPVKKNRFSLAGWSGIVVNAIVLLLILGGGFLVFNVFGRGTTVHTTIEKTIVAPATVTITPVAEMPEIPAQIDSKNNIEVTKTSVPTSIPIQTKPKSTEEPTATPTPTSEPTVEPIVTPTPEVTPEVTPVPTRTQ